EIPGVQVRELDRGHGGYLDVLLDGYEVDSGAQEFRRMLAVEHATPGLRHYLATVDGRPAAAAALFTAQGTSLLAGAATLPGFRGRGCQTALIARRLADAAASSDLTVVTAAFASASHDNLARQGFQITHTRMVWH
ncbi:MAG TPA: GNAT family N-acetyltransferase, partial [Mycobacteriales bacterium]